MLTVPSAVPHVKAGTLTALGVTDLIRSPALPDVPPLNDSSVTRGINTKVWYGVFGPPGLPAPVVQVIADATAAMVKDAPFR
ncbi:MAG TPA: tripartite tricarboxylate transporter substrate-binding protein, partial [Ramlibacter sp.]|nr:tripartite tricarboxylate transporter substrate-binding protein [Ramlibacter sp.]